MASVKERSSDNVDIVTKGRKPVIVESRDITKRLSFAIILLIILKNGFEERVFMGTFRYVCQV